MTTVLKLIVTTLASLLLFSCSFDCVRGEGKVSTQEHALDAFDQVVVTEGWDAILIKGDTPKLVVTANENLHEILEFSVEEGRLKIGTTKNCIMDSDANTIKIHYQGPLQEISASSGAEITSEEIIKQTEIVVGASSGADLELRLDAGSITADASSGANIELEGISKNFNANASSGSEIEAKDLESQTASGNASSGAEISLTVKKSFKANASSGGDINYYGNPENIDIKDSSGGNVDKL